MGGGIKLRQGERDLKRKQGERWGKWKDLSPPKDWRRSSRGWREALPVAGISQQGRQGLGTRRTCWLCSSVRAEYDLGHEEKSTKVGPGKLEKERGQASTGGQPALWGGDYRILLVQVETKKEDRKPLLETKKKTSEGRWRGRDGFHPHRPRPQSFLPPPSF